jgi:hypothetical protein
MSIRYSIKCTVILTTLTPPKNGFALLTTGRLMGVIVKLLWVKRVGLTTPRSLPVFTYEIGSIGQHVSKVKTGIVRCGKL